MLTALAAKRGQLGAIALGPAPTSPSLTKFIDNFAGTDGTLLTAHTPDNDPVGSGWVENLPFFPGGGLEITGNAVTGDTSSAPGANRGNTIALAPAQFNDKFEVDIEFETFTANGIQQAHVAIFDQSNLDGVNITIGVQGGQTFLTISHANVAAPAQQITVATTTGVHTVKVVYNPADVANALGYSFDGAPVVSVPTTLTATAFDCAHIFIIDDGNEGIAVRSVTACPDIVTDIPDLPVVSNEFYDTFTDTDGVLLTAHTPDIDPTGAGWQMLGADVPPEIGNNAAQLPSPTGATRQALMPLNNYADKFEITANIEIANNIGNQFVRIFAINSGTFTGLSISVAPTSVLIVDLNAGVFEFVTSINIGNIGAHKFRLSYEANYAKFFIDDVELYDYVPDVGTLTFDAILLSGNDDGEQGFRVLDLHANDVITESL